MLYVVCPVTFSFQDIHHSCLAQAYQMVNPWAPQGCSLKGPLSILRHITARCTVFYPSNMHQHVGIDHRHSA
jgi:hypothetical protein